MEEERQGSPPKVKAYLWLPTPDMTAPSTIQLEAGVVFMDSIIKSGFRVYVHCRLGHGRGPTMVIAYLVSTGMGVSEAVAFVKSKRTEVHLEDVQVKALQEFSASI